MIQQWFCRNRVDASVSSAAQNMFTCPEEIAHFAGCSWAFFNIVSWWLRNIPVCKDVQSKRQLLQSLEGLYTHIYTVFWYILICLDVCARLNNQEFTLQTVKYRFPGQKQNWNDPIAQRSVLSPVVRACTFWRQELGNNSKILSNIFHYSTLGYISV